MYSVDLDYVDQGVPDDLTSCSSLSSSDEAVNQICCSHGSCGMKVQDDTSVCSICNVVICEEHSFEWNKMSYDVCRSFFAAPGERALSWDLLALMARKTSTAILSAMCEQNRMRLPFTEGHAGITVAVYCSDRAGHAWPRPAPS